MDSTDNLELLQTVRIAFSSWLPVYLGITFVLINKRLSDKTIYAFLQIALGMMLNHFVFVSSHIFSCCYGKPLLLQLGVFLGGFFLGTAVLLLYVNLREAIFEGPADIEMMEEFQHKFFFLEPYSTKKENTTSILYVTI